MNVAVDAMGGDYAPGVVVQGAVDSALEFGIQVTLVGDEGLMERARVGRAGLPDKGTKLAKISRKKDARRPERLLRLRVRNRSFWSRPVRRGRRHTTRSRPPGTGGDRITGRVGFHVRRFPSRSGSRRRVAAHRVVEIVAQVIFPGPHQLDRGAQSQRQTDRLGHRILVVAAPEFPAHRRHVHDHRLAGQTGDPAGDGVGSLRVSRQNETALTVARFLASHPKVSKVYYPFLESHPHYAVATRQMRGGGGVVSFETKGTLRSAKNLIDSLKLCYVGPSLGGVETLITHPAMVSYYDYTRKERYALGIKDTLFRLAVGIEDVEDIIEDLERGLSKI